MRCTSRCQRAPRGLMLPVLLVGALATQGVAHATVAPAAAPTVAPTETNARAIMEAVHVRSTGDRLSARMQMTILDPSGSKRVRVVQTMSKKFPGGTRQLILFESPADVRGTGLLTVDYDAGGKVDDQWLYLPSLHKPTRISSGDKSGAFMGSDISFADMTKQDPAQYDFKLVQGDAKVGGEAAWLIESRPKTKKAQEETGYVKSLVWVSKDKLMVLQVKSWVRKGRKLKFMKFSKVRQVGGVWFAHKISARTTQAKQVLSTTVLSFAGVKMDDPAVEDADFTTRRLEQGL